MLERKVIKYLIVLLLSSVFYFFAEAYLQRILVVQGFSYMTIGSIKFIFNLIPRIIVALFLFFDCKGASRNYILIPILGLVIPIIGVCFFLIDTELLNKLKLNGDLQ